MRDKVNRFSVHTACLLNSTVDIKGEGYKLAKQYYSKSRFDHRNQAMFETTRGKETKIDRF
ncbi:hypothetical protein [Aquibacillus rhizosphaerae]|uniref:Uncharacterized protein n=1 Tax=Aquibacillus rhizosphaerae TaxID=3051431 RepID=A0ABT7L550_9BACI|nr:hypothetical protein [Aquibacillus sp. LR5S19]MDL4840993.1 hypothetical protein [Aquibacillus sp. LR5S19]